MIRTIKVVVATVVMLGTAALPALSDPTLSEAEGATFRIRDRLALDEVAEVTTVYVDGQLVRSFRLDAEDRDITIPVTVPDGAGEHHYSLCGHIEIRDPDGNIRKQPFAVGGIIADVTDRDFEAFASDNFTRFYLVDMTPGRPPAVIEPNETNTCTPAVS